MVSVCPGEPINFICSTNGTYIVWNVTTRTVVVSRANALNISQTLINNNDSNIIARRIQSLQLTSVLMVFTVTDYLNGVDINCTSIGSTSGDTMTLITRVHVVKVGQSK